MKKIFILTAWLVMLALGATAQVDSGTRIPLNLTEAPFSALTSILKEKYQIRVYYKDEWTTQLKITIHTDTLDLKGIMQLALEQAGIGFIIRPPDQVFVTGPGNYLYPGQLMAPPRSPETSRRDSVASEAFFGLFSYDKSVHKISIGNSQAGKVEKRSFLTGRLTNRSNGEPLIGATIVVEGSNIGNISDGNGSYTLALEAGSTHKLLVSCMGMESETWEVELKSSGTLNIELTPKLIDIQEVVVRSDKHDNVRGMQMGFQRIAAQEIKSIPVVMGERDILKVANLMPGVQTVGEGAAGFNVRGSSSDQNLFILNDIPILNTGHLFGFFSAFNPDLISGFNLYKSNFPAEYGSRLASVFEISTRKGNKKQFGARGSISPVTASLLAETPLIKDRASGVVSVRSTYSDWILNRLDDAEVARRSGSFYDIMTGVHLLGKNNSSWQLFGYYSKDKFSLSETNAYSYENRGASLVWDKKINPRWAIKSSAVFSQYLNSQTNTAYPTRGFEHPFSVQSEQLKTIISGYPAARHKVTAGGEGILHHLNHGTLTPAGDLSMLAPIHFGSENGLEYAFFAADEFTLSERVSLYGGLRYSFFRHLRDNSHYAGPEYRTSVNFQLHPDLSIKMGYNRMRQYLFMLSNTIAIAPSDRWKLTDMAIVPPVSDQISLGIYKNFPVSKMETSAEIYFKNTHNTIEYRDGVDLTFDPMIQNLVLQGVQRSWGAEFLIRKNEGRLTGWISYTWSRAMVTVNGEEWWQKINNGITYPANYDKPHALNLVGNLKLSRRVSISSNLVYNSGRPITYPTGYYYVDGFQVINYSQRNEYRIPDYFRMDVSVNLEGNLIKEKFAHGSWMLSVYNLTGRRNAYSIYFKNEEGIIKGYRLSIYGSPIITLSYNFKLGNYAVN